MTVSIRALERGGYSTYGRSFVDPRRNVVMLQGEAGEVVDLSVTFPSEIASVTKNLVGLDATDAEISGSGFTARINGIQPGGSLYYDVTLATGAIQRLRLETSASLGGSFDYGSAVLAETEEALILEP